MTSNKINGLHINGNKTDRYKPANVEIQPQPQSQPLAIEVTICETAEEEPEEGEKALITQAFYTP
jgi:hypothetical protein